MDNITIVNDGFPFESHGTEQDGRNQKIDCSPDLFDQYFEGQLDAYHPEFQTSLNDIYPELYSIQSETESISQNNNSSETTDITMNKSKQWNKTCTRRKMDTPLENCWDSPAKLKNSSTKSPKYDLMDTVLRDEIRRQDTLNIEESLQILPFGKKKHRIIDIESTCGESFEPKCSSLETLNDNSPHNSKENFQLESSSCINKIPHFGDAIYTQSVDFAHLSSDEQQNSSKYEIPSEKNTPAKHIIDMAGNMKLDRYILEDKNEDIHSTGLYSSRKKSLEAALEPSIYQMSFSLTFQAIDMLRQEFTKLSLKIMHLCEIRDFHRRKSSSVQKIELLESYPNYSIPKRENNIFYMIGLYCGSIWRQREYGKIALLMPMKYQGCDQYNRYVELKSDRITKQETYFVICFDLIFRKTQQKHPQKKTIIKPKLLLPRDDIYKNFLKTNFVIIHMGQELMLRYSSISDDKLCFVVYNAPKGEEAVNLQKCHFISGLQCF